MAVLVVGATGGIGSRVAKELVANYKGEVRLMCRSAKSVAEEVKSDAKVVVIEGTILKMKEEELNEAVKGCEAIISCLGHRVSAIWSPPYDLCREAVKRLIAAAKSNPNPVKLIAVSTVAATNPDGSDNKMRGLGQWTVFGLLYALIPPHRDNVRLMHYLHDLGEKTDNVEWCLVRPDGLHDDENREKMYEVYDSLKAGLFNARKTSRLNVARFMTELTTNEETWNQWKFKKPVVYDQGQFNAQ